MAKLSSIARDTKKAETGVWREFEGIEFLIARIDNPDAKKELRRLSKREKTLNRGKVDDERAEALLNEAISKTVLKGWRKLEDDDGNEITFTPAKALEILSNPAFAELRNWIVNVATSDQEFRVDQIEEAAKN